MNRRGFLRCLGLGAGAAWAGRGGWAAEAAAPTGLPHVVVILADDMGYGDVTCLNAGSKVPTPHLDRLASEGVTFTDAHSASAVCTPTRYALLTGTYAWRTPLKQGVLWAWDGPLIAPDTLTLGGMLGQRGYDTACIGKWHLGWSWPTKDGSDINDVLALGAWNQDARIPHGDKIDFTQPIAQGPTTRGFDYYFGDDVPNFPPYCFIENDRTVGLPSVPKPKDMFGCDGPALEGWRLDAVMPALTNRAAAFIRAQPGEQPFGKRPGRPFFLYFPLTAPHTPIAPEERFWGASEAGRYGDYVHQVDHTVGEVLRALDETGQADNTLVVFTSDNGSPARDGANMGGKAGSVLRFGHNPSYIYRGKKADIWDGGHRVPCFARWPGRIAPGRTCAELFCSVDLMATIAPLVGYTLPNDAAVDSYDMTATLLGHAQSAPIREALVHHSIQGMFALRQGRWKLIAGKGSGGWTKTDTEDAPPGQLYDLEADPGEKTNLYAQRPEAVARLEALLERYKTEGRSVPRRG